MLRIEAENIPTNGLKPIGGESNGFRAEFVDKDTDRRDDDGQEDGGSINIYFDEIRGIKFSLQKNRISARKILKAEIALWQLQKVRESEDTSIDSSKITDLLELPRSKYLLDCLQSTIVHIAKKGSDKKSGLFKTTQSALRQENWIKKKIENGNNEDLLKIIDNRIRIAREGLKSYDTLCKDNIRLAAKIAKKHKGKGVPEADLLGFANEGLMRAAAKYNYQTGFAFSTYATGWIEQYTKRGVLEYGRGIRLPIHVHEKISGFINIKNKLEQELDREPTVKEVATKAGISVRTYQAIMNSRYVDSLNRIVGKSEGNDRELGDVIAIETDFDSHLSATRTVLREKIIGFMETHLTARERKILELRFGLLGGGAKTLEEVGVVFGVSRERIRQIEEIALRKLRRPEITKHLSDFY